MHRVLVLILLAVLAPGALACARGVAGPAATEPSRDQYADLVDKDATARRRWADLEAVLERQAVLIPDLASRVRRSTQGAQAAPLPRQPATLTNNDLRDPAKLRAFEAAQREQAAALEELTL